MSQKFEFTGLVKADAEKRQLHGTIYRSDKIDSQNEFMTAEELTKAAHVALANGIKVDVGHSGEPLAKQHAALVESSVIDDNGTKLWKGIVQLSEAAWNQLVKTGKVAAFSIGGRAPRRAVQKDGKTVHEIHDAVVEFVSLVAKGAIGEPVVAKSDDIATLLRQVSAKLDAQAAEIAALKATRVGKSSGSTSDDFRKQVLTEHAVRNEAKLGDLRAQHMAKSDALQQVWEGATSPGETRVEAERRLCRELAAIEQEMSALGKSSSVDLTDSKRSAFAFRGGESKVYRAVPSDSGFELRPNKLTKGEEEIDLSNLRV
jgi:hypothetical protein